MNHNYKQVYFAHPISHYNTEIEMDCIELIYEMLIPIGEDKTEGCIDIFNPNQKIVSNMYKNRKDDDPFELFRELVRACDIVVGTSFIDGTIGAGVAEEMRTAINHSIPTYLILLDNVKLFLPVLNVDMYHCLSREETREKINKGLW